MLINLHSLHWPFLMKVFRPILMAFMMGFMKGHSIRIIRMLGMGLVGLFYPLGDHIKAVSHGIRCRVGANYSTPQAD